MDPEKKGLNFIFPTQYAIPQKFKVWPLAEWVYLREEHFLESIAVNSPRYSFVKPMDPIWIHGIEIHQGGSFQQGHVESQVEKRNIFFTSMDLLNFWYDYKVGSCESSITAGFQVQNMTWSKDVCKHEKLQQILYMCVYIEGSKNKIQRYI